MPITIQATNAPGVYMREGVAPEGRVPRLATFNAVYMFGRVQDLAGITPGEIYPINDENEAKALKVTSLGLAEIRLFFANYPSGTIRFIPLHKSEVWRIDLTPAFTAERVLTVKAPGQADRTVKMPAVPPLPPAGVAPIPQPTLDDVVEPLTMDPQIEWIPAKRYLLIRDAVGVTVTSPAGFTATKVTGAATRVYDWATTIANFSDFGGEMVVPQGFCAAPEAFVELPIEDAIAVGQALIDMAGEEGKDWMSIIDCTPGLDYLQAKIEGLRYVAPMGHGAYYHPYVRTADRSEGIPPSMGIIGIALSRYAIEGIKEPPAGENYPMRGVIGTTYKIDRKRNAWGALEGINSIRQFIDRGTCVYGARTRANTIEFSGIPARVICNVLIGTLIQTLQPMLFKSNTAYSGSTYLQTIRDLCWDVCYLMWLDGNFYGISPSEAFEVICDYSNNTPATLQNGIINVDVFCVPVPFVERIFGTVQRVGIGMMARVTAERRENGQLSFGRDISIGPRP